jgi:hypothetical protein
MNAVHEDDLPPSNGNGGLLSFIKSSWLPIIVTGLITFTMSWGITSARLNYLEKAVDAAATRDNLSASLNAMNAQHTMIFTAIDRTTVLMQNVESRLTTLERIADVNRSRIETLERKLR